MSIIRRIDPAQVIYWAAVAVIATMITFATLTSSGNTDCHDDPQHTFGGQYNGEWYPKNYPQC